MKISELCLTPSLSSQNPVNYILATNALLLLCAETPADTLVPYVKQPYFLPIIASFFLNLQIDLIVYTSERETFSKIQSRRYVTFSIISPMQDSKPLFTKRMDFLPQKSWGCEVIPYNNRIWQASR